MSESVVYYDFAVKFFHDHKFSFMHRLKIIFGGVDRQRLY